MFKSSTIPNPLAATADRFAIAFQTAIVVKPPPCFTPDNQVLYSVPCGACPLSLSWRRCKHRKQLMTDIQDLLKLKANG